VILSAIEMATGGGVQHHLEQHAGMRRNTIILTGFEALGTRSSRLVKEDRSEHILALDVGVKTVIVNLQSTLAYTDGNQRCAGCAPCNKR
jgi:metallo-beta-lactamase family protein